jgi:hypothetical protein
MARRFLACGDCGYLRVSAGASLPPTERGTCPSCRVRGRTVYLDLLPETLLEERFEPQMSDAAQRYDPADDRSNGP